MTYIPPAPRTWADGDDVTATRLNANFYRPLALTHNRPACSLWLSANQTIGHATFTRVELDLTAFDTDQMTVDPGYTGRVTVRTTGIYEIAWGIRFDTLPGVYEVAGAVYVNSTDIPGETNIKTYQGSTGTWNYPVCQGLQYASLSRGAYVELMAWQSTGGGNLAILGGSSGYATAYAAYCHLSLVWMGQV